MVKNASSWIGVARVDASSWIGPEPLPGSTHPLGSEPLPGTMHPLDREAARSWSSHSWHSQGMACNGQYIYLREDLRFWSAASRTHNVFEERARGLDSDTPLWVTRLEYPARIHDDPWEDDLVPPWVHSDELLVVAGRDRRPEDRCYFQKEFLQTRTGCILNLTDEREAYDDLLRQVEPDPLVPPYLHVNGKYKGVCKETGRSWMQRVLLAYYMAWQAITQVDLPNVVLIFCNQGRHRSAGLARDLRMLLFGQDDALASMRTAHLRNDHLRKQGVRRHLCIELELPPILPFCGTCFNWVRNQNPRPTSCPNCASSPPRLRGAGSTPGSSSQ